jgi:glycosyltransferase involved in cell wall biosynthesis
VADAGRHADVIVVDDCSPDDTAARAEEAGATVVRAERQLGYEGAIARGFAEAEGRGFSHVMTMDADGEHDPALVQRYRHLLIDDGVPLVLGVRPRKQRLAETAMGIYVQLRFGAHDILCGMKGYSLDLYRANGGFAHHDSIGTELAVNSIRRGVRFVEVPVSGLRRSDLPRFDRKLRANLRILSALKRVILDDLKPRQRSPDAAA